MDTCSRHTHDFFFSVNQAFDEKEIKHLQKNPPIQQNETMNHSANHNSELERMMYTHRELVKQYQDYKKKYGMKHLGVKRTLILIDGLEEKMANHIPKDIIAKSCERL